MAARTDFQSDPNLSPQVKTPPGAATSPGATSTGADDAAQANAAKSMGADRSTSPSGRAPSTPDMPDLQLPSNRTATAQAIDLLHDVQLYVAIELGRARMSVEDVLKLGEGSIVELDKLAGDPVDVLVNDRLVARGEVLVLNDTFSVRINEIVSSKAEALAS